MLIFLKKDVNYSAYCKKIMFFSRVLLLGFREWIGPNDVRETRSGPEVRQWESDGDGTIFISSG